MFMELLTVILAAASLCADCFAVSLCSGVAAGKVSRRDIAWIAAVFAVIQTALLIGGWAFGALVAPIVHKISHIIGFLLLLYVGGSMLVEGIRADTESRDLRGLWNVILGGIATSIDAAAVGAARAMEDVSFRGLVPLAAAVFVITALSVVAGLAGGRKVGQQFGRWAEIAGGLVLIGIGISFLF